MTPHEIREIVHQHLDAEARHDAAEAAATYASHGYYHHVPVGLRLEGRDAVAARYPDRRLFVGPGLLAVPQFLTDFLLNERR